MCTESDLFGELDAKHEIWLATEAAPVHGELKCVCVFDSMYHFLQYCHCEHTDRRTSVIHSDIPRPPDLYTHIIIHASSS